MVFQDFICHLMTHFLRYTSNLLNNQIGHCSNCEPFNKKGLSLAEFHGEICTGISFSEPLILASSNMLCTKIGFCFDIRTIYVHNMFS